MKQISFTVCFGGRNDEEDLCKHPDIYMNMLMPLHSEILVSSKFIGVYCLLCIAGVKVAHYAGNNLHKKVVTQSTYCE